jgi:hypothetical protein
LAAAAQKLTAMRELTARSATVNLGMPEARGAAGRSSPSSEGPHRPPPGGHDGHTHGASLKEHGSA